MKSEDLRQMVSMVAARSSGQNEWADWRGRTNAEDPEWVARGLSFWRGQAKKNPRDANARFSVEMFEEWARKLGIKASERMAMPLLTLPSLKDQRTDIFAALKNELGVDPRHGQRIFEKYLVKTDPDRNMNRFHYFGIYLMPNGVYVGGNAWGRIGYKPRAMLLASGDLEEVKAVVQRKIKAKMSGKDPYMPGKFASGIRVSGDIADALASASAASMAVKDVLGLLQAGARRGDVSVRDINHQIKNAESALSNLRVQLAGL